MDQLSRVYDQEDLGKDYVYAQADGMTRFARHEGTLVVYVAGMTKGMGSRAEKGGFAIYMGNRSGFNKCSLLPEGAPISERVAEILAVIHALDVVSKNDILKNDLKTLIIRSSSENLVRHMTTIIWKWAEKGWKNSERKPVQYANYWKEVHGKCSELEKDFKVVFNFISKARNIRALNLAKSSLGGTITGSRPSDMSNAPAPASPLDQMSLSQTALDGQDQEADKEGMGYADDGGPSEKGEVMGISVLGGTSLLGNWDGDMGNRDGALAFRPKPHNKS